MGSVTGVGLDRSDHAAVKRKRYKTTPPVPGVATQHSMPGSGASTYKQLRVSYECTVWVQCNKRENKQTTKKKKNDEKRIR